MRSVLYIAAFPSNDVDHSKEINVLSAENTFLSNGYNKNLIIQRGPTSHLNLAPKIFIFHLATYIVKNEQPDPISFIIASPIDIFRRPPYMYAVQTDRGCTRFVNGNNAEAFACLAGGLCKRG